MISPEIKAEEVENTIKRKLFARALSENKCVNGVDSTKRIGFFVSRKEKEPSLESIRAEIKKIIGRLPDNRLSALFFLVKDVEGLSDDKLLELSEFVKKFAEKARQDIPELPEAIPEEKMYKSGDVMEYLEREWGCYLTYFGAEKDILFQNYFRQHQPKYLKKLYNKLYYEHEKNPSNPKPEVIIKRLTDKISEKDENYSEEEKKELKSVVSAKYYKKRKANNSFSPEM